MRKLTIISVLLLVGGYGFSQKSEETINFDFLIGTWVPVDSVYEKMEYKYTCIEITKETWMTFECINAISSNTPCPYTVEKNEIRIVCHEMEQMHYKIKKLIKNELLFDEYSVKQSGKLKRYRKNIKFIRRN